METDCVTKTVESKQTISTDYDCEDQMYMHTNIQTEYISFV